VSYYEYFMVRPQEVHAMPEVREGAFPRGLVIIYGDNNNWFAALRNAKNYDGSWTEYGNLIGAPIEK
jgi:3-mercaptopyruvate sulfurtransferase SseA